MIEYSDVLKETISCKTASVVLGFFTYVTYLGVWGLIQFFEHYKKEVLTDAKLKALKNFKQDIE